MCSLRKIHYSQRHKKYIVARITKELKALHNGSYKTLVKETEEVTKKWAFMSRGQNLH
jgi:hypothetical protein